MKFFFGTLSVQGSHLPDFLPNRVAELPGFEHLDGGPVFEDLPGDFDEAGHGKAQAQAAVLLDGNLLGLVPFLLGNPRGDAGRETQHHVRGALTGDDAEIPADVFLDRGEAGRQGEGFGTGLHGADAGKGEVPYLPPQAAEGNQVPVPHVTQEVQRLDDPLCRLVLVRRAVDDLQGALPEQGGDDGVKDGFGNPVVRHVFDRYLLLQLPESGRGAGRAQREEFFREPVQGCLEVPVGDGGREPQRQAEGV